MTDHPERTAALCLLGAVVLLVFHLVVPFALLDHSAAFNSAGIEDQQVSASDVAADFGDRRPRLPDPTLAFAGLVTTATALALLLVTRRLPPRPAGTTRWLLTFVAGLGAWLALASSAYWVGTTLANLLGVISTNPQEGSRLWALSPLLVAAGSGALAIALLGQQGSHGHARSGALAVGLLVTVLVLPWSLQLLDGDERRDLGQCSGDDVCEGRIDWYSAWGASHGAELERHQGADSLFASNARGHYGGILLIAATTEATDAPLFQHAAWSLHVLTATAWSVYLLASLGTLAPLLRRRTDTPRLAAVPHVPALAMTLWGSAHLALLMAYQWRPSHDPSTVRPAEFWSFTYLAVVAVYPATRLLEHLVRRLLPWVVARRRADPAEPA